MNLIELKAAFRAAAEKRGIDPVAGSTVYQAANVKADLRKAQHFDRARQAVYANAELPDGWTRYAGEAGETDGLKVERQASRNWWVYSPYWVSGGRRITLLRPKWSEQPLRFSDRAFLRHELSLGDEQLEQVVSRIPPPDYEAVRNIRREAKRLEGRGEEIPLREDRQAATREAWEGHRQDRAAYRASLPKQMPMAFAFA